MSTLSEILLAMTRYFEGDRKRINHLIKVHSFARIIGEREALDDQQQFILEAAALTHDIGIKVSEKKYCSSAGTYQEIEGPSEARSLLQSFELDQAVIDRVCWLIAHHHTYDSIQDLDHQILVEADFLVNADEDQLPVQSIMSLKNSLFRTAVGIELLTDLFLR